MTYKSYTVQEDPPIGTLQDVARRHGTDVDGARRIMGLNTETETEA